VVYSDEYWAAQKAKCQGLGLINSSESCSICQCSPGILRSWVVQVTTSIRIKSHDIDLNLKFVSGDCDLSVSKSYKLVVVFIKFNFVNMASDYCHHAQTRSSLHAQASAHPIEYNKSLQGSVLFNVEQGQLLADPSFQHLLITTDLCRSRSSLRRTKPSLTCSKPTACLSVVPFLYVFSRDRLAWVTLNGPEPLLDVAPPVEARINSPQTGVRFEWEWSINVDFCDPGAPWRSYIPVQNYWLREGIEGWVCHILHRINFQLTCRPHISSYRQLKLTSDSPSRQSSLSTIRPVHGYTSFATGTLHRRLGGSAVLGYHLRLLYRMRVASSRTYTGGHLVIYSQPAKGFDKSKARTHTDVY